MPSVTTKCSGNAVSVGGLASRTNGRLARSSRARARTHVPPAARGAFVPGEREMPLPLPPNGARSDGVTVDPHLTSCVLLFSGLMIVRLAWKGGNPLTTTPSDAAPAWPRPAPNPEKRSRGRAGELTPPASPDHHSRSRTLEKRHRHRAGPRGAEDVEDHSTVPHRGRARGRTSGQAAAAGSSRAVFPSWRLPFQPAAAATLRAGA
jgi:hypothetical protein